MLPVKHEGARQGRGTAAPLFQQVYLRLRAVLLFMQGNRFLLWLSDVSLIFSSSHFMSRDFPWLSYPNESALILGSFPEKFLLMRIYIVCKKNGQDIIGCHRFTGASIGQIGLAKE
jgi:hypothetical protein